MLRQREHESIVGDAYTEQTSQTPFNLTIMTDWQRDMLIKYGHGGVILMDATMGTNVQKVPILLLATVLSGTHLPKGTRCRQHMRGTPYEFPFNALSTQSYLGYWH